LRTPAGAQDYLTQSKSELSTDTVRLIGNVPGYPKASAYLTGNADKGPRPNRLTALLVVKGRVVVGVFTTRTYNTGKNLVPALDLMKSALQHLSRTESSS